MFESLNSYSNEVVTSQNTYVIPSFKYYYKLIYKSYKKNFILNKKISNMNFPSKFKKNMLQTLTALLKYISLKCAQKQQVLN